MDKAPANVLGRDLSYEASFAVPAFAVVPRAAELAEAAFKAFQPLGIKLEGVRFESASRQPADFLLVCATQRSTVVRYRLGSVEVVTADPSVDVESGTVLLDTVYAVLDRLGVAIERASQTFTFAYHLDVEGVDVASWFKKHGSPPVPGLQPVGLTYAAEIPEGSQYIDFQPSYVHPGPSRLFIRVTSRFLQERPHADLVRIAAQGVEDLWARMALDVSWKE